MKYKTTYDWMTRDDEQKQLLEEERLMLMVTEKLIELMEKQEISRADLAKKLGTSKAFISQILNGGRNMTLRSLFRLARALGYDLNFDFRKISSNHELERLNNRRKVAV